MKIATIDDEYRIFIVNEYFSHINTKIIEFCVQKRIILLCFFVHIIHILQFLNVNVFDFLSIIYKNNLHAMTQYDVDYVIDKIDFLKLFKSAREKAMTISNIQNAYKTIDFESFDFQSILHEYRNRTILILNVESSKTHYFIFFIISFDSFVEIICENFDDNIRNIVLIFHNDLQMRKLLKQIIDMSKNVVEIIQKINKSTLHVLTRNILQNVQIEQLMTLIAKKKFKKQRKKINSSTHNV